MFGFWMQLSFKRFTETKYLEYFGGIEERIQGADDGFNVLVNSIRGNFSLRRLKNKTWHDTTSKVRRRDR